jgi:hypothetical protein
MAGMLEGMSDAEVIVKRFKPPRLAEVEAFLADLEPNP